MAAKKDSIVAEGKTKTVWSVVGDPHLSILAAKKDITKNDDPTATQQMAGKDVLATTTTCGVFAALKQAGLPVAYECQLSPTEFLAPTCEMIKLEVVARRYAVGSYLKRHPEFEQPDGDSPHRFNHLVFELFLKTTGGQIRGHDGTLYETIGDDPETGRPVDDPFILNPEDTIWVLKHPKIPSWDEMSELGLAIADWFILPPGVTLDAIEEITRKAFLFLEAVWTQLGFRLIDFKLEFGIDANGNLLVADVVDNDSWRLRTADWQELSKQLFRDSAAMDQITSAYALVAGLVESGFPGVTDVARETMLVRYEQEQQ
ncbi:MAG: phosphoribosylaminoimidazolesuccinocarboxamide synthase [Patescibacteria group bacterium]|nr:phosphoribosylaminoimidazolesuccinocarboxamide synthase [Patescibacteria group bacterium]